MVLLLWKGCCGLTHCKQLEKRWMRGHNAGRKLSR